MSIALVPRAIRHTLVISAIELPPFMTYLEVPEPTLVVKPDAFRAGEYEREVQQKPDILIPTIDDRHRLPVMGSAVHPGSTGAGSRVPPIDVQAPELRTADRRARRHRRRWMGVVPGGRPRFGVPRPRRGDGLRTRAAGIRCGATRRPCGRGDGASADRVPAALIRKPAGRLCYARVGSTYLSAADPCSRYRHRLR
jgi:hypothetical protein